MTVAAAAPIGRVAAEAAFIALVVVDGARAAAYRYPFDDSGDGLDFDATIDGPLPIGNGRGLIVSCASSGIADVYRFGDALVIADIAEGDDDAEAEAELLEAIAGHPTTKAIRIGAVEVPSGVIVLLGQHRDGPQLDVARIAKRGKPVKAGSGVAVPVPPGRYEVWREWFRTPVQGRWGQMAGRVRVVPARTKVREGEPLATVARTKPTPRSDASGKYWHVDPRMKSWTITRTISAGVSRYLNITHLALDTHCVTLHIV